MMAAQAPETVFLDWPEIQSYLPLDPSRREVRFLKLSRGESALEDQNLPLVHESLDTVHHYYALSYAWGDPSQDHRKLTINNDRINTRATVFHFLNVLRHRLNGRQRPFNREFVSDSVLIWMDIFCINQRDVQERNQQVSMFGDIYRGASAVLAWVGQPDVETEWMANALLGEEMSARSMEQKVDAFKTFASQPYWTRMWVKQELVLANQKFYCWGKYCAERINGQAPIFVQLLRKPRTAQDEAYASLFWAISDMRSRVLDDDVNARPYMSELIKAFGSALCGDPRDKIFALRAIAYDGNDFPVNYAIPPAEVAWKSLESFDRDRNDRRKQEPEFQERSQLANTVFGAMKLTVDGLLRSLNSQEAASLELEARFHGIVSTQGTWFPCDLQPGTSEAGTYWKCPSQFYMAISRGDNYWASSRPLLEGDLMYSIDSRRAFIVRPDKTSFTCLGGVVFTAQDSFGADEELHFTSELPSINAHNLKRQLYPTANPNLCCYLDIAWSTCAIAVPILGRLEERKPAKFLVDRAFLLALLCSRRIMENASEIRTFEDLKAAQICPTLPKY